MKFIPLFILTLFLFSCNKDKDGTTFTIQAQDRYNSADGSAYANVEYSVKQSTGNIIGAFYEEVLSGTFDANGYASFNLKMEKNKNYHVEAYDPEDIICDGRFNRRNIEKGVPENFVFRYTQCARVKLVLNNIDCLDPDTQIQYTSYWGSGDENINTSGTHTGCTSTEKNYLRFPEGTNRYEWTVTKDGVTSTNAETFELTKGDSLVFEIDY